MPPPTAPAKPSTTTTTTAARGRQNASKPLGASGTTASVRAEPLVKPSGPVSRSASGAVNKDVKSKPLKAPPSKPVEKVGQSTSTRSVPPPTDSTSKAPLKGSTTSSKSSTTTDKADGNKNTSVANGMASRSISGASSRDIKSKSSKAPLPKPAERITKSTSTGSVPSPPDSTPTASAPAPKESIEAPSEVPTVLAQEVTPPELPASNTKPPVVPEPPPQNPSDEKQQAPVQTSDPLQVAAQLYPWLYMTSTLDACFQTAEQTAKKDLAARAQQIAEDESDIKEQKTRFEAEQAAEFYDALSTDAFAQTAPKIMQAFLAHGEACERSEAEAMQLALKGAPSADEYEDEDGDWDAPLKVYAEMLDTLESLHDEAVSLEASILELTAGSSSTEASLQVAGHSSADSASVSNQNETNGDSDSGAQAQILGVFNACLPVLRARIANLAMAQELVDSAQENVSISLRMESLGLLE